MITVNDTLNLTDTYHKTTLGPFFLQNMFLIMALIFIVFFVILLLNLRNIREQLPRVDKRTLMALIIIFLVGFTLRNSQYIYGYGVDGIHYTESARTWLHTGAFMKGCAFGDLDSCRCYVEVLFPAGFPFIILLLYMAFGVNSLLVMILNGIISSLAIILTFFIARMLFNRNDIGLYSAVVFSVIPIDVFIAGTAAVRTVSLFFMGLTTLFLLMSLERDRLSSWMLVAITFSMSIYIRQENSILLIPLICLFLTRYKGTVKGFIKSDRFLFPAILLIITQIPVQHWILFVGGFGNNMPDFSLSYLPYHLPVMFSGLFVPSYEAAIFSPIPTMLFLFSAIFIFKRKGEVAFLWLWFISLFMLYALYFQCSAIVCGEHIRYMSSLSISYSILAGLSLFWITKRIRIRWEYLLPLAFVTLFLTSGLAIPTTIFQDARLLEPRLGDQLSAIAKIPAECTVIIPNYMATGSDVLEDRRKWVDLDLLLLFNGELALSEMRDAECLVLVCDPIVYETELNEQKKFITQHFDLDFYFEEGVVNVYNVTPKEGVAWKQL